jgi:protein PhnA
MADLASLSAPLHTRADSRCELCGGSENLSPSPVPPMPEPTLERCVLLCSTCSPQLAEDATLNPRHWYCLQESAWSQEPAVQVQAWRLLQRLQDEGWAQDLLEQLYIDEQTLAWAQSGSAPSKGLAPTLDSNGAVLQDGDSVTLIKDLSVKRTSFTAKRGTMVKNIRLSDDPALIEGRVNKTAIFLKTCFLKRA